MKTFNNISNQCFHENKVEKANNEYRIGQKKLFENEKKSFSSQLKFAEKAKKSHEKWKKVTKMFFFPDNSGTVLVTTRKRVTYFRGCNSIWCRSGPPFNSLSFWLLHVFFIINHFADMLIGQGMSF